MQPLPAMLYAIRAWKNAKVGINYHVHVNNALYSVPHAYARKQVDVCITNHMVEGCYKGRRIAVHERQHEQGTRSTNAKHMTEDHRQYLDRMHLLKKARGVGTHAEKMAKAAPGPIQSWATGLSWVSSDSEALTQKNAFTRPVNWPYRWG